MDQDKNKKNKKDNIKIIKASEEGQIYTQPELYDIAFDFRNVPDQVDFLLDVAGEQIGRPVASALELACGPAYHAREMARRSIGSEKLISEGLDLEPVMVDYTKKIIKKEELNCPIHLGDMRNFKSDKKYDLIYILMASFAHLQTNRDIIENLDCAANMLNDGGVYIISTAHPRDFYGDQDKSVKTDWDMTRGETKVVTSWGGTDQDFDPLTELDQVVVSFDVTTPEGKSRYEFPETLRRCSMMTFLALLRLSNRFQMADMYGEFDRNVKLTNDKKCWRFIPILKKK